MHDWTFNPVPELDTYRLVFHTGPTSPVMSTCTYMTREAVKESRGASFPVVVERMEGGRWVVCLRVNPPAR